MSLRNKIIIVLACALVCFAAGTASGLVTIAEIKTWYVHIQKPTWNPPNWLFAPVWSTLYLLMGIALGLVIIQSNNNNNKRMAIAFFAIQFLLNMAWSFIFFKMHHIGLALAEILAMWIMILITIITFSKINKTAAWLLVPYISWVSFASLLTFTIWKLN